ncbi:GPI-linked NAD(P)(+)--arginine ADP-ribosyltransferase 1-like [Chaetodon auriga]|uniref:GPI-linked NAD(P)(+)--arginine ADP-ribosyltransferase 1-like n=1 Tax=Chaetodon auriga TaxID=39042 RepID=UPI00403308EF
MAVMAVWAAVLIAHGVSTGIAMESPDPVLNTVLPLDMAPNSVDDRYNGCKDKMMTKVQSEYLPNERNTNEEFKSAWGEAEGVYNQRWRPATGVASSPNALGKEEFIAVYVYTSASGNPHIDFNAAVRDGRSEYKTTFRYHALHFFLTTALQKLKPATCQTGYRGVDRYFSQDVLNKEIRFGSFASTTILGLSKAKNYGAKSCFKIHTCFGADVSVYSKFGEAEAELLIPPYEVFKVKNIMRRSEQNHLECEVVYEVQSTKRPLSNLNCAL